MMRTFARSSAFLLAGATALVLSACGSGSSSPGMNHGTMMGSPAPSAGVAAFNDADVSFAQSMIPHHRQAVQMAALAAGRATDPEVKRLAATIQAAQQPEIETMTGWLTTWGRPAAMASMSAMDHGSMPGMMTGAELATLTAARGPAFHKQFLTMMVSHHEGAIRMAQQETAQGVAPQAKALAAKISTDQQAEITTMTALLAAM